MRKLSRKGRIFVARVYFRYNFIMHYKKHIVVNTILGSLVLRMADLPVIFKTLSPAVLVGFLIDADHWLYHVWKQRTLSVRKITRQVKDDFKNHRQYFYPFHTIEFGLVFTLVVYYTPLAWPWAFGYWIHLSSDAFHNYRLRGDISSWFPKWIGTLQSIRFLKDKRRMRRISR